MHHKQGFDPAGRASHTGKIRNNGHNFAPVILMSEFFTM
jgi:hypothetical protein